MTTEEMDSIREAWFVKVYNEIAEADASDISEIPPRIKVFLNRIPYKYLVAPFVIERFALKNHKDRKYVASIFGITEGEARGIGKMSGYYKKKNRKREQVTQE